MISFGQNQRKSHPFQSKFAKNKDSIFLHAETCAIHNALKRLDLQEIEKASLYILRIRQDKSTGMSKPCAGCMQCIATFGIRNVFYTEDNSKDFTKLCLN